MVIVIAAPVERGSGGAACFSRAASYLQQFCECMFWHQKSQRIEKFRRWVKGEAQQYRWSAEICVFQLSTSTKAVGGFAQK